MASGMERASLFAGVVLQCEIQSSPGRGSRSSVQSPVLSERPALLTSIITVRPMDLPMCCSHAVGFGSAPGWTHSSPWQKSRGPRYGQTGPDSRRRRSADPKSRRSADPKSRRSADPKSRRSADPKSRRSADPKSRRSADPKSRRSADPKSRRSADPKSRRSADPKSRRSADPKSRRSADPKSRRSASPKSRRSADPKSRRGAGPKPRRRDTALSWEESATTKTAPFRRNPWGAGGPPTYQTEAAGAPQALSGIGKAGHDDKTAPAASVSNLVATPHFAQPTRRPLRAVLRTSATDC